MVDGTGRRVGTPPARSRPLVEPCVPEERLLDTLVRESACLLAVASAGEALAVLSGVGLAGSEPPRPWTIRRLDDRLSLLVTGVGKANAAGAAAFAGLGDYAGVLSLGIAGAAPGARPPPIGSVVLCEACVLADDGLQTDEGFATQSEVGFPAVEELGERFPSHPAWVAALRPAADAVGVCATVSTCSGTDRGAGAIAARTGALCEDMESAAVALAAARLGRPFASLRVVSNRTGDRSRQGWDLGLAFSVLSRVAASL